MIQGGGYDSNLYMDDIIYLLDFGDSEYCMDAPSKFHMRESYTLKYQSHYLYTPTYI